YTAVVSPLAYNDGEWHHAAGVLQSGLARHYVDCLLESSRPIGPFSSVRSSTGVQIGLVASDLLGDLDEVLVFSRALSDAEIAARSEERRVGKERMQQDMQTGLTDGRMKDLSGHVNHGIITGTTHVA